jgi:para-nitrobenzyl esterase
MLIGTNRDEWNLFAAGALPQWSQPLSEAEAIESLRSELPRVDPERLTGLFNAYRESRKRRGLPHDNRALLRAIAGDQRFRIPSIRFADAYAAQCPETFMYLFTHESPALRGALGACHALDLPFVFGTLDAPQQDRFAGTGAAVEKLSRTVMNSWIAFAKNSDPNHAELDGWSRFDTEQRATMRLDAECALELAPLDEERRAWDGFG